MVATEETVKRELQAADYASRQGAAVLVVADPETDDGLSDDSLQVFTPVAGLAPPIRRLVAMVPLHMLGLDLTEMLGINPDRRKHVDTDYVRELLYSSTSPGAGKSEQ